VPQNSVAHPIALEKPIGIYYEHPDWFRPLFQQLDERGVNWTRIDARNHSYNPSAGDPPYSLVFNRMSPSAWQRGLADGIFYTLSYLAHLEARGVRVVNGARAFTHEISKASQLDLLEGLGLLYPKAVVIHNPSQALSAAREIGYPLVIKPNIGGSGAGIVRFSNPDELKRAVEGNSLYFGIDSTALIQEFFPARNSVITRAEVLGGKFLYAIQIHTTGETFNLCPADICQNTRGEELARAACPVDAPKSGLKVEGYDPPIKVIKDVELIMQRAGIDVGGIEYVIDDRDGRLLYYDINALSNFVADPERVVGFNPYARLADYLIAEAQHHESSKTARLNHSVGRQ
jgi:Carbamoyl-phosphate synthase L chain, ATP binding domain